MTPRRGNRKPLSDAQMRRVWEARRDGVPWPELSRRFGVVRAALAKRLERWLKERLAA